MMSGSGASVVRMLSTRPRSRVVSALDVVRQLELSCCREESKPNSLWCRSDVAGVGDLPSASVSSCWMTPPSAQGTGRPGPSTRVAAGQVVVQVTTWTPLAGEPLRIGGSVHEGLAFARSSSRDLALVKTAPPMSCTSKCRMFSVRRPRFSHDRERLGSQVVEFLRPGETRANAAVFARNSSSLSAGSTFRSR